MTFFIRHTGISITDEALEKLRADDTVAIHYPARKRGRDRTTDNDSLEPGDYPKKEGGILRRYIEFAESGGYICATYRTSAETLVGYVEPGTKVRLLRRFRWVDDIARVAVLKTIQLTRVRRLDTSQHAIISVGRPRQGTFVRWHRAGDVIERLVNGQPLEAKVENLNPDRSEMMCSEYLRTDLASRAALPKLKFVLIPVGRTMRDVDILGVAEDGRQILAQVTMHRPQDPAYRDKLFRLTRARGSAEEHLVMFCDTPQQSVTDEGVHVASIRDIYDHFRKAKDLAGFLY